MRRAQLGSTMLEIIPVLLIVILVVFGALQVSLFMSGRHAAELGAYRASRVLEQRAPSRGGRAGDARGLADQEARKWCAVGYPSDDVKVQTNPRRYRARVRMEMDAFFPTPTLYGRDHLLGPCRVEGVHPPELRGAR